MSVKKEIYSLLTANAELTGKLAKSVIPGAEALPAIYDLFPGDNANMPYMLLTWSFPEGAHWAQVAANLEIDIYTDSGDTTETEAIKDLCLKILSWEKITSAADGKIHVYPGGIDEEVPEPEPGVSHWQVTFLVKYWRQALIAAITNK